MAHRAQTGTTKPGTVVIDGLMWAPVEGATATAEEFAAARSLFLDLHHAGSWSPWVLEDRAAEIDAATAVMAQWKRAEPGFRQMGAEEVAARLAQSDAEIKEQFAAKEQQRQARIADYDERRDDARLALLEQQSILDHAESELAGLRNGSRFPAMEVGRRAKEVAAAADKVAAVRARIATLASEVGDPKTVIDQAGQLPCDRRETTLLYFKLWREREVRTLRQRIPQLQANLTATKDRAERRRLRTEIDQATRRHDVLADMPPLTAADMCADCDRPTSWHGWVVGGHEALLRAGPCPAWPEWAARIRHARDMLLAASRDREAAAEPAPKPQPLAVVKSGLPLSEVIAQLTAIRTEHPNAQVRRGRANRWEIWPT